MTSPTTPEQLAAAFESWFRSEMAEYEGDGDMIQALLRAKENIRWGWGEGYMAARAQALDEAAELLMEVGRQLNGNATPTPNESAAIIQALKGKQ